MGKTGNKLERSLLDEATWRELVHWALVLRLDPSALEPDDSFSDWINHSGAEIREADEGGAVVRAQGSESWLYINAEQLERAEEQLKQVHREEMGDV